jgi:serine/threonine protein kinase
MEDDRLYIQTELCSGTLAEELAAGPMAEPRRFKVLREILLALDFIHRQYMVHLDIKPGKDVIVCSNLQRECPRVAKGSSLTWSLYSYVNP